MAKFEVTVEGLKSDMVELHQRMLDRKLLRLRTKLMISKAQQAGQDTSEWEKILPMFEADIVSSDSAYKAAKADYEKHINSISYRVKKQASKTMSTVKTLFSKKPVAIPAAA